MKRIAKNILSHLRSLTPDKSKSLSKGKTYSYTRIREIDSYLNKEEAKIKSEAIVSAKEYALKGIPSASENSPSPAEMKIRSSYRGFLAYVDRYLNQPISRLEGKISQKENELKAAISKEGRTTSDLNSLSSSAVQAKGNRKSKHIETENGHIEEEVKALRDQIKIRTQELDKFLKESRPKYLLFGFLGVCLLFLFGEGYMMLNVVEYIFRESQFATYMTTATLGIAVMMTCHFLGKNVSVLSQNGVNFKKLTFLTSCIVLLAFFYVIGVFRQEFLQYVDASAPCPAPYQFTLLNALMAGVMTYASFRYTAYDSKSAKERAKLKATIAEKKTQLNHLRSQQETNEQSLDSELDNLNKEHIDRLSSMNSESEKIQKELDVLRMECNELTTCKENHYERIQHDFDSSIQLFRDKNYLFRAEKDVPVYWNMPFSLFSEDENSSDASKRDLSFWLNKASVILFIVTFGLISCSDKEIPVCEMAVIIDVTDPAISPLDLTANQLVGLSTTDVPKRWNIELTTFSDVSFNPTEQFALDESNDRENQFVQEKAALIFQQTLNTSLDSIRSEITELERSCIYRPLCHRIREIQGRQSIEKIVVISSDMLEYSDIENFYSKKYDVLGNFNDNGIRANLNKAELFPDCAGITFYVIQKPNRENDRLMFKARRLYFELFKEYGAEDVIFTTNL